MILPYVVLVLRFCGWDPVPKRTKIIGSTAFGGPKGPGTATMPMLNHSIGPGLVVLGCRSVDFPTQTSTSLFPSPYPPPISSGSRLDNPEKSREQWRKEGFIGGPSAFDSCTTLLYPSSSLEMRVFRPFPKSRSSGKQFYHELPWMLPILQWASSVRIAGAGKNVHKA